MVSPPQIQLILLLLYFYYLTILLLSPNLAFLWCNDLSVPLVRRQVQRGYISDIRHFFREVMQMKVKLIRRGKLAGLVHPSFEDEQFYQRKSLWQELEIPRLMILHPLQKK